MMPTTESSGPLVSVIIPAYNAAPFIRRAVESALAQTWPHKEILVINDGSTDDTGSILKHYEQVVRIFDQRNGGLSNARNRGIKESNGEYIAFLDADDYWKPKKLERQVEILKNNPDIGFCSTCAIVEDPEHNFLNKWPCPETQQDILHSIFLNNGIIPGSGSGVMANRNLFDIVGMFDESLNSLEDIDMWMRMSAVTSYHCIDDCLTVIVKQPGSMSSDTTRMLNSMTTVMKKNRHLLPTKDQGRFWKAAYSGMLTDYAKQSYRNGSKAKALRLLCEGFCHSPYSNGKLILSLFYSIILNKNI